MILKDIINKNSWSSTKTQFLKEYPQEEKNIEGYKSVYEKLCLLPLKKSDMRIVVDEIFHKDLNDEPYVDVTGKNGTLQKELEDFKYFNEQENSEVANSEVSYALEYSPWAEWLGMEIDPDSANKYSELEIIAHCLYEMTFFGFDEESIKKQCDELKRSADEIDNMTEEERKKNLISFEDFEKKQTIEDLL